MSYENYSWEEALKESHETLLTTHPRSPKKLIPPHQWIKETLKKYLGSGYEYYAAGEGNGQYDREYKVPGLFYDKMVDITVLKNNKVVGAVSFKFVASNYSQKSNNYFENLVGECFNIQANDIRFCHILVIRDKIPYYNKNQNCTKIDKLNDNHLSKYIKIKNLNGYVSIPKKISINVINLEIKDFWDEVITPKIFNNKR